MFPLLCLVTMLFTLMLTLCLLLVKRVLCTLPVIGYFPLAVMLVCRVPRAPRVTHAQRAERATCYVRRATRFGLY